MGSRLEKNSNATRKRIEKHTFDNEEGEEYKGSKFGGFTDYFRRKKIKLQNLDAEKRSQAADNPQIFRGVVAHVNGYTQPTPNDLHNLIVSYGGGFSQYLDGKTSVTHIVVSSLTPKKIVEFRKYRIVKPAWIVDSVKAGRLLPWDAYRVIDEGAGQKVLHLDGGKVSTQVNNMSKGYREQSNASWYTSQLVKTSQQLGKSMPDPIEEVDGAKDIDDDEAGPSSSQLPYERTGPSAPESPNDDVRPSSSEPPKDGMESSFSELLKGLSEEDTEEDDPPVADDFMADDDFSFNEALAQQLSGPPREDKVNPIWLGGGDNTTPNKDLPDTEDNPSTPKKVGSDVGSPKSPTSAHKRELTAEEHNAILLADPRLRKSTTVNPDFLEQYYRESRLHHLSTWKADLKSQLQALTAEKSLSQIQRLKRLPGTRRYVMHVDFDSFFVAVSLKKCPEFADVPAVVAHGAGPGSEIASCNYPARKFGVKNGMWMKKALEMCKDLKVLPYDFPGYEEASRLFYEAILATGGIVQSVSVDEALIDVTSLCLPAGGTDGVGVREGSIWREQNKADELAQELRNKVRERTGCAVSVGIGGNILLAKLALRKAKPAGQHQVKPEEVLDFIADLEVQSLPGVASSIGGKLEEIGVKFVKDIREVSKERLISALGPKTGEKLWLYSRGIDKTEVGDQVVRKSVSAEVNWGVRFETQEQAEEFIDSLCGELNRRLLKERVRGKQLTMKIMRRAADAPLDPPKNLGHGKCDTFNKSTVLGVATNAQSVLSREAISILRGYGFSPGELRGLGVQMTRLEPLKVAVGGEMDGSQRRLQFKTDIAPKVMPEKDKESEDPIKDDVVTPKKAKPTHFGIQPPAALIDRPDSPSRKFLNTLGTQFILPTQVDPEILAQLPDDIKSKLIRNVRQTIEARPPNNNRIKNTSFSEFPTQSQIDPDILNSFPADLRTEILAEFNNKSPSKPRPGQSLLPQSPRKTRILPPSHKPVTSTRGRRGGGSLLSRFKAVASRSDTPTLTQTNFLTTTTSRTRRADSHEPHSAAESDADLDPDVLAALPDDIRREVLDNARRAQLKRTAGLEVQRRRGGGKAGLQSHVEQQKGERTVKLPPRPARPTFTTRKLSSLGELREALSAWVEEFDGEGPYVEDVQALGRYLRSVVGEEGDMGKAVGVVKWLEWLVVESRSGGDKGMSRKWVEALEETKDTVREAVEARGLGAVLL